MEPELANVVTVNDDLSGSQIIPINDGKDGREEGDAISQIFNPNSKPTISDEVQVE